MKPARLAASAVFVALGLAVLLFMPLQGLAADARQGSFGVALAVDGEGFFLNPTLKTVTVTDVVPASPAALGGIVAKDLVIQADGHVIAGAKARDLQPLLKRKVGESLHLRLQRPDGTTYDVTLVAVPKPAS